MFHQDSIQMGWAYPPVLHGGYEREYHESWGEHLSAYACTLVCSWLPTQFETSKEEKWYEEPETGWTVVAPCDTRNRASCNCESEQNVSVVMERQGKVKTSTCCGDDISEANAEGCCETHLADAFTTSLCTASGLGTHEKGGQHDR
jgi:hypothetical protein